MRILIADRNGRLLESISRTFAARFAIQTATTRKQCTDLLSRNEFDLVVISEKLADGPGLQLLGQITRRAPRTLRIFAARRTRLQLLEGRLEPFGLFHTLAYPINPRDLLSALTRASTLTGTSALTRAHPSTTTQHASAPTPFSLALGRIIERISLTSTDATLASNVPQRITPRPNLPPAPTAPNISLEVESAPATTPSAASPPRLHAPLPTPAPTLAPTSALNSAPTPALDPAPPPTPPKVAEPRSAIPRRRLSPGDHTRYPSAKRTPPNRAAGSRGISPSSQRRPAPAAPTRSRAPLAAAVLVVLLAATLALKLAKGRGDLMPPSVASPEIAVLTRNPPPVGPTPLPYPAPPPGAPQPTMVKPAIQSQDPPPDADPAPIADPSSFGSEAYEPIYSN